MWQYKNIRLLFCVILFVGGASISNIYGKVHRGSLDHRLIALIGVVIFIIFSIAALNILTKEVMNFFMSHRMLSTSANSVQFIVHAVGYLAIILITLELVGISVARLLLGGAVLGIILGVAAQQALANFFAGVVLVITHPFAVGQKVTLVSGALGGKYSGTIIYLGLTHTRIKDDDNNVVSLPNASLLSGAAIIVRKTPKKPVAEAEDAT